MRTAAFVSFAALLLAADASANTGVFFGSGHTITLGKTEQVQLVSEDVTIRPHGGWDTTMDSVDYRCKFVLKNLTAKPVTIQVGFPLDSQFVKEAKEAPNATDLVLDDHFIVRDEKTTYHIRFVANDHEKKFFNLFLWDVAFGPAETKTLHVAYQLRMSQVGGKTRTKSKGEHVKPWHAALECCVAEYFGYVTETGKSWAGPVERATFRLESGDWERCLRERMFSDTEPPDPKAKQEWWEYGFPLKAGAVYQEISPEGGKEERSKTNTAMTKRTWEYRNYKPGTPLSFFYCVVGMPRTAADCDSWVRHVLGRKPSKADVMEMREIVAAFYGIAPPSESARKFAEQQLWYHPTKGLQESKLEEEQRAILKRLDAMVKKVNP